MKTVNITISKQVIPTYTQPDAEELPMFAENRVHQRSSGNPYPNKVVLRVNREEKTDVEYTVVTLENEYLKIEILPEIGGRIFSALDKTTGYDFFYKQHVIKPALIGVLGSWISGGVEFNWPFHHRASGFMPCDFTVENQPDGTAVCHLSEHDPIDRMKGMVSILLRPGEKRFETRMNLYNRTPDRRSFLWWENAAVPVNPQYQIFFPQDVTYVNFHYLKSRISYPVAGNGIFNGIPMEEPRDISYHKNTVPATSYFASASEYDFFGGYDHGKQCGVVHIGDHHISPGKKMFTWGYCQLAKSWKNALTDTDGQYAELMAGSYSDNQPNFSWLDAYETKKFSQFWYPISKLGTPTFANLDVAFKIVRDRENLFQIQSTVPLKDVTVKLSDRDRVVYENACDLTPDKCQTFSLGEIPEHLTVVITAGGKEVARYTEKVFDNYKTPEPISDMPAAKSMNSAQELYLAGVHVNQYRDPAVKPDSYWKEALRRDICHIPSLIAMAAYEYSRKNFKEARAYIDRALRHLCTFNTHPESGEAYYISGKIYEQLGDYKSAYDDYYRAAWAADCVGKAMTRIGMLDIRNKDYAAALSHAETALEHGKSNNLAFAVKLIASEKLGRDVRDEAGAHRAEDPLDYFVNYLCEKDAFYAGLRCDAAQICLDLAADMDTMGLYGEIAELLRGLVEKRPDAAVSMIWYALAYYAEKIGQNGDNDYQKAIAAPIGAAYPVRQLEADILADAVKKHGGEQEKLLLGCVHYHNRKYAQAAALWEECRGYMAVRNLAVAYYSHLHRQTESLDLMKKAVALAPDQEQLTYETVVLMDKMGVSPQEKVEFLTSRTLTRDDCFVELAKAYNQQLLPEKAIETLMNHRFVPCEGGEHAIADQYMFAHLVIGRRLMQAGKTEEALSVLRKGQVLPQSLGAGIWNHCKLIPQKYYEAVCLERLGRKAEADEIFRYIATVGIEYFSNMHLKELPYFQAKAWRRLGNELKAQELITKYYREWKEMEDTVDNGFFETTPFFISFTDDARRLRTAKCRYLLAICKDAMGDTPTAEKLLRESVSLNNENLYAISLLKQGFAD